MDDGAWGSPLLLCGSHVPGGTMRLGRLVALLLGTFAFWLECHQWNAPCFSFPSSVRRALAELMGNRSTARVHRPRVRVTGLSLDGPAASPVLRRHGDETVPRQLRDVPGRSARVAPFWPHARFLDVPTTRHNENARDSRVSGACVDGDDGTRTRGLYVANRYPK